MDEYLALQLLARQLGNAIVNGYMKGNIDLTKVLIEETQDERIPCTSSV